MRHGCVHVSALSHACIRATLSGGVYRSAPIRTNPEPRSRNKSQNGEGGLTVDHTPPYLLVCVRAVVSLSLFGVPVASESWWVCGVRAWLVVILFSLYPLLLL